MVSGDVAADGPSERRCNLDSCTALAGEPEEAVIGRVGSHHGKTIGGERAQSRPRTADGAQLGRDGVVHVLESERNVHFLGLDVARGKRGFFRQ